MQKEDQIENIYNLYVDDLFTYALYLGFEREAIMDAIHDVFYKLAANNKMLENVENVKFYLFRSLKNRLIDLSRTRKNHLEWSSLKPVETPFGIEVSVEDDMIDEESQQQIKRQITAMLNSLTERQREIIYLRYVQEYDYVQISDLLNITINSCRKLASKAMKNLREKYGVAILAFLLV